MYVDIIYYINHIVCRYISFIIEVYDQRSQTAWSLVPSNSAEHPKASHPGAAAWCGPGVASQ